MKKESRKSKPSCQSREGIEYVGGWWDRVSWRSKFCAGWENTYSKSICRRTRVRIGWILRGVLLANWCYHLAHVGDVFPLPLSGGINLMPFNKTGEINWISWSLWNPERGPPLSPCMPCLVEIDTSSFLFPCPEAERLLCPHFP